MKHLGVMITAGLLALGCDVERGDLEADEGIVLTPRQWECAQEDDRFKCSVAMAAEDGELPAYACATDEDRDGCPPADALGELAVEARDALDSMHWACLLTGEHQRECIKELVAPDAEPVGGPDGGDSPGQPGGGDDVPSDAPDDSTGEPELPPDCEPASWEAYFCDMATAKFQAHGIDIEFPCEIFDAEASMASTLPGVPTGAGPAASDAPSCHDAEWDMREQAWLDSVNVGCFDLGEPITVLCQQAANYAPGTGECRATGTW